MAFIFFGLVALAIFLFNHQRKEARQATWGGLAKSLGLSFRVDGGHPHVSGTLGQSQVHAYTEVRGSGDSKSTWTMLQAQADIPLTLSLKPEGLMSSLSKAIGGQDIKVGDPRFDDMALVRGTTTMALAALDHQARARLVPLMRDHAVTVQGGKVMLAANRAVSDRAQLEDWLRELVAVAEGLTVDPARLAERLASNLETEPHESVQKRLLETLLTEHPSHPATQKGLAHALASRHGEVRLTAALAWDGDDNTSLRDILFDTLLKQDVRSRALKHLAARLPPAALLPLLDRLDQADSGPLSHQATALRLQHDPDVTPERLVPLLKSSATHLFVAAARAAGERGLVSLLPHLLDRLETGDLRARTEAIRALGRLGSLVHVETLTPLTRGFLTDSGIKKAAGQAISAIQERAGPVVPGALSVVEDPDAGQLAVAKDRGGGLALDKGG